VNGKNLSQLSLGQEAIIESVEDQSVYLKLLDLGCLPGETVRLVFLAPLGDPIAIQVAGSTLSLRIQDAKTIQIRVL
jgi:ferrous iron transport protein A